MITADVIMNDIITMYVTPHDGDMYIHLYLTILDPITYRIKRMCENLSEYRKEMNEQRDERIDSNNIYDEEKILTGFWKVFN